MTSRGAVSSRCRRGDFAAAKKAEQQRASDAREMPARASTHNTLNGRMSFSFLIFAGMSSFTLQCLILRQFDCFLNAIPTGLKDGTKF